MRDPNTLYPQVDERTTNMSVAISGLIEKLPSSCMKWQAGGWKKRFIVAKSNPVTISWADKEGKPASGQVEITPGSTLTVGDLQRGAILRLSHHTGKSTLNPECRSPVAGLMIRTYEADQLFIRVPANSPNAEAEHKVCPRHAAGMVFTLSSERPN